MRFYADMHLHSHFSRATSKSSNFESLFLWAQLKGIQVIGTGDFVHVGWFKEIQEKLEPTGDGLFRLKSTHQKTSLKQLPASCQVDVRFLLSVEVSSIYKRGDKVRKVHNIIFTSSFDAAAKIQSRLEKIGNIRSDGRPILGLDSRDLLEIVLESDPRSFLVPAHILTPWFSVLGSKGGFDSIEECFGDLTQNIFALETGLSSDPPMNWRLSQLDPFVLISNSDAHSPEKLGREATIFNTDLSYQGIYDALSGPQNKGLEGTVEFFPEEGKYHYDGHRDCQVRLHPKETTSQKGLCPKCGKPVTVGVMSRVEELADQPEGRKSKRARPFVNLIPLVEIIAEAKGVGSSAKSVVEVFHHMLGNLGNEMSILREVPLSEIQKIAGPLIAEGIHRMAVVYLIDTAWRIWRRR